MVYIREAHPVDGWSLARGIPGLIFRLSRTKADLSIRDPKTIEERRAVAGRCEESLRYGIRTYVDEMDDRVNQAYAAAPTRLYLIGLDGRVRYAGRLGPFGFKPGEFGRAIQEHLDEQLNGKG